LQEFQLFIEVMKLRVAIDCCLIATMLAALLIFCEKGMPAQIQREKRIDKQGAVLIAELLNKSTEQQAFHDLEALGCPGVQAIIGQMDDRRSLADPHISLSNTYPEAFDETRSYEPKVVVDALAAILSQITGQDFGFIYNGASESERKKTIQGWRGFLRNRPASKSCGSR
jgi:hypothetical protein